MEAESIDAVMTDPPYGLSFMGKDWDRGVPGVHFWAEALRVVKPGAYLLAFGGTRTYHRLVCAIEDVGFEIRDTIEWVYGSGFPKSLDVSKAIDKTAGAEREVTGYGHGFSDGTYQGKQGAIMGYRPTKYNQDRYNPSLHPITAPATDAAREWSGWGTALKPAHEPIVVARKPLSEATVAANVLRWGTGALNIDAGRIAHDEPIKPMKAQATGNLVYAQSGRYTDTTELKANGRFPANLITDGSAEVVAMFPQAPSRGFYVNSQDAPGTPNNGLFGNRGESNRHNDYAGESGSAARFFKPCPLDEDDYPPLYYCAKASKAERDAGCEGMEEHSPRQVKPNRMKCAICGGWQNTGAQIISNRPNSTCQCENPSYEPQTGRVDKIRNHHPTVKPLSLMRYLITLCTREGATVLDPFMGSGTTGVACAQLNRNFIGCEIDPQYFEIAKRRIGAAQPVAIELPLMAEA